MENSPMVRTMYSTTRAYRCERLPTTNIPGRYAVGAMLNLSFRPFRGIHLFEWKNIFNQIIKNRYSDRIGFNAQADNINDMEYYHSSRPTFNTQFTGSHTFDADRVDWSVGYAFAQRNLPTGD